MNKFQQGTPQVQPPPSYSDKSFLWSWVAGVGLPFVQSLVTGIMAMIVTAVIIYAFNGMDYLKPMLVIGAIVSVGSWFILQRRWLKLTEIEKLLGVDLNGGGIGKDPVPVQTEIWIKKVNQNKSYQADLRKFSCSHEQLLEFCKETLKGKPISRRGWTPKSNGFSDTDGPGGWRMFQSELIKFGLIEQQGSGLALTEEGESFCEEYVRAHSPTDEEDGEYPEFDGEHPPTHPPTQ